MSSKPKSFTVDCPRCRRPWQYFPFRRVAGRVVFCPEPAGRQLLCPACERMLNFQRGAK